MKNRDFRKVSRKILLFVVLAAGLGLALPAHTPTAMQLFVYEHTNYEGAFMGFTGLREEPDLRCYNTGGPGSPNWNDRISSLKVGSDIKVVLFEHINYQGKSFTIPGPANISSLVSSGWNDRASSFRIVPK